MSRRPVLPTGRAAVFTAVCVGLAVVAHTWMSGARVPAWAVLAGSASVFGTARLWAGRERSLPVIGTLMGLDQTGLHLLFETAQNHAAAAVAAVTSSAGVIVPLPSVPLPGMSSMAAVTAAQLMPQISMSTVSMSTVSTSTVSMSGMGMSGMPMQAAAPMRMTPGMFAAHALAALVCAWWLRRGEAAVHTLVRAAAALIADWLRLPPLAPRVFATGPVPRLRPARAVLPAPRLLRFAVARRGPPSPLFT